MKPIILKSIEMVIEKDDFGFLVHEFVRDQLRGQYLVTSEWMDTKMREWWPKLDDYWTRRIQTEIEVAILLDEPPRTRREPLANKEMWKKIIADLRPPKSPFTIKYVCSKCKKEGVKLWRDYQTCADACELECASCLAPDIKVGDDGCHDSEYGHTDQIGWKVPAIPVGNTFWGYTSTPSQDVEWWKALPTY